MSCLTCGLGDAIERQKEQWRKDRYNSLKEIAKKAAQDEQKTMVIYKQGIEWNYTTAAIAASKGITAIEVLSKYS